MNRILIPLAASLALAAAGAWAKAPPDATGECKDGTYTNSPQKEGACSSHGGVKKWLAKTEKADAPDKAGKSGDKAEKAAKSSDKTAKTADKAEKAAKAASTAAASKPADATGECKDGTYTTAATKSGACAGHKGVKTWYGGKDEAPKAAAARESSTSKSASSTASPPPAPAPSSSAAKATSAPAPTPSSKSASTPPSERTAAAGGGAGKVWVNTDSKVYHCEKDAVYGKTKKGEYMTEAQAKASGARPSRGKECS